MIVAMETLQRCQGWQCPDWRGRVCAVGRCVLENGCVYLLVQPKGQRIGYTL